MQILAVFLAVSFLAATVWVFVTVTRGIARNAENAGPGRKPIREAVRETLGGGEMTMFALAKESGYGHLMERKYFVDEVERMVEDGEVVRIPAPADSTRVQKAELTRYRLAEPPATAATGAPAEEPGDGADADGADARQESDEPTDAGDESATPA